MQSLIFASITTILFKNNSQIKSKIFKTSSKVKGEKKHHELLLKFTVSELLHFWE